MGSNLEEKTRRLLILIKLDSNALFKRITQRRKEYLHSFSLHRTRDHFSDIFESRLHGASPELLINLSEEIIFLYDQFYNLVDDMFWYLKHTQDMGATVDDKITKWIIRLQKVFDQLDIFVDAELHGERLGEDELDQLKTDLHNQGEDVSGL
ncbi:MAG: hypothetical protein ACO20H_06730 [Bacteriovoracaceae bacterium]